MTTPLATIPPDTAASVANLQTCDVGIAEAVTLKRIERSHVSGEGREKNIGACYCISPHRNNSTRATISNASSLLLGIMPLKEFP
jgi:hypothetical protein